MICPKREGHRLTVFVNGVLRKIFGHTRKEVRGVWSGLYNEGLHDVRSSLNVIQMTE